MSTKKDYHHFLPDNDKFFDNKISTFNQKNQFKNINLNQNNEFKDDAIIVKSSKIKLSKNGRNDYDFGDSSDLSFGKNASNSWKKNGNICKTFKGLNISDFQKEQNQWKNADEKNSSAKNSTLSLHIAAYENAIETLNDGAENKQFKKETTMVKTWKNSESILPFSSVKMEQNPFEFPRQQRNGPNPKTPEVMRFRASQKLLNPNHQTSNARQKKVDRLVDVAEELSILYDRKEINEQQFITRMNDRYEELGYKPYQVYKAWSKILVNVKTRFESNNNVFAKASDKRMAIIQRKFEPNFCRPGISSSSSSRTNARRIDLSQVFSAANARQEPLLEFLGPDEHERETERVREMNIDTTLPDGRIVETEVLPGNEEEIQDVDEPEGPPTTNRDIVNNDATMHSDDDTTAVRKENGQEGTKLQRKRKRIRTNYTPKRSKKNALTSSIERRSSAQPSYAARTSPTKNIRKAARKTPAAVCLTRSRTTAAAAARPSRQTATISNLRAAPRQRRRTPPAVEEEEEEEDEEDSMNNSEPRRSSRLRDLQTKEQQCFNNLQESASSSSFDTPNQPTQLQQPQKHADERRDDSFEEYAPTSQQNALTTSNRRGIRNQQQPLGVNPLNRRQALLNQQQQLTPSRSQRPDEYHSRLQQRRADKQQLTEQAAVEEPEQITLEHPFQVEQPESAATLSQSRPPQTAEPLPQRQFERPGILRHPIRFGVVSQNPSLDQQSPGNYQQQTDMLPPHHRHQHIAPQYQFQQGVLQQPATLSHFGNFGALQCRPPFLQQQPPGNVVADHQQRTTTSAVNPSLDIQHTASATLPQNQQPPIHEIRQIVKQQIPPPSLQPPPSFTVAGDQQQQTATSALNSSHELRHTAPANPGHIEQFVQPQNPFQQLQQPPVPDMNQPQLQHTAPATLPQQPPANPQVVQPQNPLQQEQQTSASQIRFQQLPPSEIRDPQPSIGFLERITEIHGKFLDSVNQILGNINNCNNNNN